MNERIKKLMIQSNPHGDFKDCEWVFEKFAELIVRECGIVADHWVNDEDNGTNLVSEKLKQYFGVGK